MKKKGLQDFGEKIVGARKDLWAGCKISEIDIESLTEDEKRLFMKKDVIWPKEDREKLLQEGIEPIVIFWREEMRKAVYTTPKTNGCSKTYIVEFAEFCVHFSEVINCCITLQDIRDFYKKNIFEFLEKCAMYSWDYVKKEYRYFFRGNLVLKYLREDALKKAYSAKPFMESKEDFIRKKLFLLPHPLEKSEMTSEIRHYPQKITLVVKQHNNSFYFYSYCMDKKDLEIFFQGQDPKGYFLLCSRTSRIVAFGTKEECEAKMDDYVKKETELSAQKNRSGKQNLLPPQLKNIQRTGSNYEQNIPRTISGEMLVRRFKIRGGQFGNYTNEKDRRVSLLMAYDALEDLAAAMGIADESIGLDGIGIAFGARGRGNALAHYEEMNNVINLTKLRGAGSLAHEYGHALDSYILKNQDKGLIQQKYKTLQDSFLRQDGKTTSFFQNSRFLDQKVKKAGNGYWSSREEMFARAFACYIRDRLDGKKSDYLVGHSECAVYDGRKAIPVGEERIRINHLFEELINEMTLTGILTIKTYYQKKSEVFLPEISAKEDIFYPQTEDGQLCFF